MADIILLELGAGLEIILSDPSAPAAAGGGDSPAPTYAGGSGGIGSSRGSQSRAYSRVVAFKAFAKATGKKAGKAKGKAKSSRSRKQRDEELVMMLG